MDVLVTGRRCTISDAFREQVTERIGSIERFRDRVIRVEVQLTAEPHSKNPVEATTCEITLYSRGPVVRAEASAEDKSVAFEGALEKLKTQLKKAADRRKNRRGLRVGEHLGSGPETESLLVQPPVDPDAPAETAAEKHNVAGIEVEGDGPLVVREKRFPAAPLTLAQALDEMELVGHDFFLYVDAETREPSVVYRRKAYDYGVIHLEMGE